MKFLPLASLGLLASEIHALDISNHHHNAISPPIYILGTSQPATSSLSKALDILGYIRGGNQTASPRTYVEVSSGAQLVEVAMSHPEAKIIIPRGQTGRGDSSRICAAWFLGGTCHDQMRLKRIEEDYIEQALAAFPEEERRRVFHLDVSSRQAVIQAENWIDLSEFLGMGYSTVERLKLWHFPS